MTRSEFKKIGLTTSVRTLHPITAKSGTVIPAGTVAGCCWAGYESGMFYCRSLRTKFQASHEEVEAA